MTTLRLTLPHRRLLLSLSLSLACLANPALAGVADIANVPLGTAAVRPKPNVMFILDDSGSMDSKYMPDEMWRDDRYGYRSSQCNGVAYNPAITYLPPVDYQGTVYPNATFNDVWRDGYNTGGTRTNLNDAATEATYFRYTGTQPTMGWVYSADGNVVTTSTFYTECMTRTTDTGPFTAVRVTSTSAEAQNYANWFAYYRTRMNLMRTATGRAFASLDSNYRVGFTAISDSSVSGSNFLNIADFTTGSGGQKQAFYNKLYSVFQQSWTPLRGALSKVGQYYANRASGQTSDPVQYSCQRNYAILSTDGYWNDNIETGSYGPYTLDGSAVAQQDGDEARPMKDASGSVVTYTRTTATTTPKTYEGDWSTYTTYRRTDTTIEACTGYYWGGSYSGRRRNRVTMEKTDTSTITRILEQNSTVNTVYTRVTTNGVVTSERTTTSGTPVVTTVSDTTRGSARTTDGTWATTSTNNGSCDFWLSEPIGTTTGTPSVRSTSTAWNPATPTPTDGTATTSTTENTSETTTGGSSNSLADVAEYYWKTDLRPSMDNDVAAVTGDSSTKQHMNTFTVGLGVRGTLTYDSAYLTQTSGDYVNLKNGTKDWPNPDNFNATRIDDLWHAAVNGRGQYFSALDPTALSRAIATTLARITEQTGSGAAAAASTLTPTTGDDWIFLPSYTYNPEAGTSWYGDLRAFKFTIDSSTGAISVPDTTAGNEVWSAKSKLDARTTERVIYMRGTTALVPLTYANLTTAGLNGSLDNRCTTATTLLTQCSTLTTNAKAKVTGANLVSYLRGDTSLYLSASDADNRVFRTRSSRLGDFINASPVYVGKPPFKYADSGYAAFVSANSSRAKMVYAGGNDGMLHAFKVGTGVSDTTGGDEQWAFVPTAVIPELWRLADSGYDTNHRYYVDATPVVGDIYDGTRWRTILVGGLGAGGRGYYALDITDPTSPSLLWEISASTSGFTNLGLTYGNPIITKDSDGDWIVAFTSGINNVSSGDGLGRLYIVEAATGDKIREVSTGAGSTATPSNLSRLEGWVQTTTNNTALRFYGGDMLGNVWRFDHDNRYLPSGAEAFLLGTAKDSSGTGQPITSKLVLTEIANAGSPVPVLAFGTGRYLGNNDLTDTQRQAIYALKDPLNGNNLCGATSGACNLRTGGSLVQQSLNSSRTVTTPATVNWASQNGWFVDLDQSSKERAFLDGVPLSSGVLAFATSVPGGSVCSPGGVSYLYQFSLNQGTVLGTVTQFNTLVVGIGRVMDSAGNVSAIVTRQDQRLVQQASGSTTPSTGSTVRRATWRELID